MNLYNQVKILFEISDIAMSLYTALKYTMLFKKSKDELYIYNSIHELELDFEDIVRKYHESTLQISRNNKSIYLKNGTTIYFKTINECLRELDGYRFGKVKFR